MTAALIALLISAVPHEAPATTVAPRSSPSVQVFNAFVATEETPASKDLLRHAIFQKEGHGRAIATPPGPSSIA